MITTHWKQNPYYNDLCPYDYTYNQRALTGCVATAMAQIMKYWSYPEHGIGSHSYVPQQHPQYGTQYADFSNTTYLWSSMPSTVNSSNTAVATLMYHCGVSVNMNYGIGVQDMILEVVLKLSHTMVNWNIAQKTHSKLFLIIKTLYKDGVEITATLQMHNGLAF